jgi:beta-lactamase class A
MPVVTTPEQALVRLFSSDKASPDWFGPAFLKQVPMATIDAIVGQIRASGGALKGVAQKGDKLLVTFERSATLATVALDDQGRFTTLLVRPAAPESATIEETIAAFRALPGKVSVVLETDGKERASIEPDLALGTGSSFKMAILAALRVDVEKKKRSWKDVITLGPEHRSLPSGMLHTWPDGTPMTLGSLAGLMISISDNTATDALLGVVGRKNVEKLAPRNKPFLATAEMFKLKGKGEEEALRAYQKGDEAARRKVLAGLAKKPLPSLKGYPTEPKALDVEWFFTARELCALMKRVHDMPVMRINPGVASKSDWDSVAYKGGSEPGVLSMTTWVEKGGRAHCVSATWNANEVLDEGAFHAAYTKALVAIGR